MITVISPVLNTSTDALCMHWSFVQNACNAQVNEYMNQIAMLRVSESEIRLDSFGLVHVNILIFSSFLLHEYLQLMHPHNATIMRLRQYCD